MIKAKFMDSMLRRPTVLLVATRACRTAALSVRIGSHRGLCFKNRNLSAALQQYQCDSDNPWKSSVSASSTEHNGYCQSLLHQRQCRSFATKRKGAKAKLNLPKDTNQPTPPSAAPTKTAEAKTPHPTQPQTLPPPPPPKESHPPSLIRTDFALQDPTFSSSSPLTSQELILPTGYEIPLTIPTNNNTNKNGIDDTTTNTTTTSFSYVNYKELYDPQIHLPSAPQDWSDYEQATPLWEELAAQIGVLGRPMTVAEFMQHALMHPLYGYYSQPAVRDYSNKNKDDDDADDWNEDDLFSDHDDHEDSSSRNNPIFGPRGDFVTAPEICQVFGESIQVWMVTQWEEAMGKPNAFQWVEFGPGKGTLMADMVRFALTASSSSADNQSFTTTKIAATQKLQDYGKALRVIHLIEPSRPLRQKQQETLQDRLSDIVEWKFHNSESNDPNHDNNQDDNKQGDNLSQQSTKQTIDVYWHDSLASLSAMIMRQKQQTMGHDTPSNKTEERYDTSNMPLFVVCQEFFDALPVHAFELTKDGWRERMIDMAIRDDLLDEEDEEEEASASTTNVSRKQQSSTQADATLFSDKKRPRLRIVLAPEVTPALKTLLRVDEEGRIQGEDNNFIKANIGQVVEVCPEGILLVQDIAALLEQQGGAALIIDYGEEGSADSLRGFWKHKQTHFLSLPGQTDVTADVDFTALKHAVNYARPERLRRQQANDGDDKVPTAINSKHVIRAFGPIPQGKFLVAMGAQQRVIASIESDSTSEEEAENLFYALERLVAPEQMGIRYKVLALAPERMNNDGSYKVPPPGF